MCISKGDKKAPSLKGFLYSALCIIAAHMLQKLALVLQSEQGLGVNANITGCYPGCLCIWQGILTVQTFSIRDWSYQGHINELGY